MFEIDPDKPSIPALARILSGLGILLLIGSLGALMLAFSGYAWVNEIYALVGSVGAFLLALVFFAQARIMEQLAVISTRVKSRFAIEGALKQAQSGVPASNASWAGPNTPRTKERVIHVPDDQVRSSGIKAR